MKIYSKIIIGLVTLSLASCWIDKTEPNYVFMPNMYYSEAYEPYAKAEVPFQQEGTSVEVFAYGQTALLPPKGTVSQNESGILPTLFENTPEDYETSKTLLTSPLNPSNREKDLEKGNQLFGIYCAVCHGETGDGKGILVQNKKISGVPHYKDRAYISVGSVHYVISFGKGIMGSHASQLNDLERWQVAEYVMKLKGN